MRRWAWLWILASLLAAAATFIVCKQATPVYKAAALVLVNEAPSARPVDMGVIQTSERLARTYAETMTTRPVLEGVIQGMALDIEVEDLQRSIQAQPIWDTQLILVEVEHTDPYLAARIANAVVSEFSRQNQEEQASRFAASRQNMEDQLREIDGQIQETAASLEAVEESAEGRAGRDQLGASLALYRSTYTSLLQSYEMVRLAEAQAASSVVLKNPAIPPTDPVRPRTLTNTILAGVGGLALAAGAAFLVEALDGALHDPGDIAYRLGIPALGAIAAHETDGEKPVAMTHPFAPASEAFRSLRTNIHYASHDRPLRTILVTSVSAEDGKSAASANLAIVLAQNERCVALIDADLRRPKVHALLGLPNRAGVSNQLLQDQVCLDGALVETGFPGLVVMTAGNPPPNPAELLACGKMDELLDRLLDEVDCAIIVSPPVLPVTDASVLAPRVDGVLLVVKAGVTRLAAARQAVEQLRLVGANLLGAAINGVKAKRSGSYYGQRENTND